MQVFSALPVDDCEFVQPVRDEDYDRFAELDSAVLARDWPEIDVSIIDDDGSGLRGESDFPWLTGHVLVCRDRARVKLESEFGLQIEWLPLNCSTGSYFVLNPKQTLVALDMSRSRVDRFSSSERICYVYEPVFRPEVVAGVHIFRIAEWDASPTYVSDQFVKAIKSLDLRGLQFELLWET